MSKQIADALGYQVFTKSDVLHALLDAGPDNFLNRTAYVADRIIRRFGVWRSSRSTSQRVRRLLTNLVAEGMVTRSTDANGFYGHCWTLTELGRANR